MVKKDKIKKWLLFKKEFGRGNYFKTRKEETKDRLIINEGFSIVKKRGFEYE